MLLQCQTGHTKVRGRVLRGDASCQSCSDDASIT